jgi:hypothetical protein
MEELTAMRRILIWNNNKKDWEHQVHDMVTDFLKFEFPHLFKIK